MARQYRLSFEKTGDPKVYDLYIHDTGKLEIDDKMTMDHSEHAREMIDLFQHVVNHMKVNDYTRFCMVKL